MEKLEEKVTKLTASLKRLRNMLDYSEEAIRDKEPNAVERLDNRISESELLKEQLDSMAQVVFGQEDNSVTLGNKISLCYGIHRDIINKIDRIHTLIGLMEDEDECIFDKDSFIRGMFPNIEDYQDYLDGE